MAHGRKTGGRQKGIPNKITTDVRQAILQAFHKAGGVAYLTKVANEDPKVFCALLGKVVPAEIVGALTVRHVIRAPLPAEDATAWQRQHAPSQTIPTTTLQ